MSDKWERGARAGLCKAQSAGLSALARVSELGRSWMGCGLGGAFAIVYGAGLVGGGVLLAMTALRIIQEQEGAGGSAWTLATWMAYCALPLGVLIMTGLGGAFLALGAGMISPIRMDAPTLRGQAQHFDERARAAWEGEQIAREIGASPRVTAKRVSKRL